MTGAWPPALSAICWAPSTAQQSRAERASSRTRWASRSSAPTSPSWKTPSSGGAMARAPSMARGWPATSVTSSTRACSPAGSSTSARHGNWGLHRPARAPAGGPRRRTSICPLAAIAGGADQGHLAGPLRHRTHRLIHQHRHGRLQPRRLWLLDREWRADLPGERDHHRRKPQGHVQDDRASEQSRIPLIRERAQLPGRRADHCRSLIPLAGCGAAVRGGAGGGRTWPLARRAPEPKRWTKPDGSQVTEGDLAINALLEDRLRRVRPA